VQDNVVATVSLLEAARLAGTGRVVHASSGAVYGAEPGDRVFTETSPTDAAPNLYGPSKIAAENIAHGYVRTYGQDIRICRFMNTYGPGDTSETRIVPTAIRLALEDLPYDFGDRDDGSTSLDFLYVDDVVDGYIAAATVSDDRRGSIYNFGSRRTTSLRELVDQVSQVVDGRKRTATFSGPPRIPPRRKHLDFTRTSSDIGWYPHTDLPDGLVATVNWYRKVGVRK
jgi:nucleoside-diphosphate-sugar epimerase